MRFNGAIYFVFAELVQIRFPARIMFQVIGYVFREQNVTGITAIHHPLGDVIPAPAMLVRPLTSLTSLTGPL
jgi:hypothetical protein